MKKVKGYIFSRSFYGERVPQHIQNLVLREYCKSKKLHFILSSTEYRQDNSTYILFEILHNIKNYDGIIMYSVFQLPEKKVLRNKLYSGFLKAFYEKILSFQNRLSLPWPYQKPGKNKTYVRKR